MNKLLSSATQEVATNSAAQVAAQEPVMAEKNENMNVYVQILNQILKTSNQETILAMDYPMLVHAVNEVLNEFKTSDLKKSFENAFKGAVKSKKPKSYFIVPFILEKSDSIAIFYPCDVESYKLYRRSRGTAIGHWLGVILTLADGTELFMYYKRSRNGWVIITENMLRECACYNGMDANETFENLLMNYLLNMKDCDGMIIKHPDNLTQLAMPKSSNPMVYFEAIEATNGESLKALQCAVGARVSEAPEVDVYVHWSNMSEFYSIEANDATSESC